MTVPRLVNLQQGASLLTLRHVFYGEPKGFGCCLEPPITRTAYAGFRFAGVYSGSARVIEPGHEIALAAAEE